DATRRGRPGSASEQQLMFGIFRLVFGPIRWGQVNRFQQECGRGLDPCFVLRRLPVPHDPPGSTTRPSSEDGGSLTEAPPPSTRSSFLSKNSRTPRSGGRRVSWLPTDTLIGFTIAAIALLVVALVNYRSLEARDRSATRVQQTYTLLGDIDDVVTTATEMESAKRGYLLSGADSSFSRFERTRTALPVGLSHLRRLVRDDETRSRAVEEFAEVIERRIQLADEVVALARSGQREEAIQRLEESEELVLIDRINALV